MLFAAASPQERADFLEHQGEYNQIIMNPPFEKWSGHRTRLPRIQLTCPQWQSGCDQANAKIEGLLLTGGLDKPNGFNSDDGLRDQTFSGQ